MMKAVMKMKFKTKIYMIKISKAEIVMKIKSKIKIMI
jgi:hypothetical protein